MDAEGWLVATSIFFNGRLISVPGSYSEVDASGLEQVGLGANGIVAVLGTGVGGKPASEMSVPNDFIRITKPEAANQLFRSGDLREVAPILFAPAKDPDILAGAQEIVAMKVNPATQAEASFSNAQGVAMTVESLDYGAFTDQINITIADGTNQGKLLTITFEDVIESVDDLGGDDIFNLTYTDDGNGWDTMNARVEVNGDIPCDGTRDESGLDGAVLAPLGAPGAVEVLSDNVADVGQTVTVYGFDASGDPVTEEIVLNGLTAVEGTQVFAAGDVLGAKLSGTIVGTVNVRPATGGANILALTAGTDPITGMVLGSAMYVSGLEPVSLVADGAETGEVIVEGLSRTGAIVRDKYALDGTNPVLGELASLGTVLTWNGTTTVAATSTTGIEIGSWIRLDSDGQWFKVTGVVTDTSVTIANPDSLTIPTGATSSSVTNNVVYFSQITAIILGDVAAARTVTVSTEAARSLVTVQSTLLKARDYFNNRSITGGGFTFTLSTGSTSLSPSVLDATPGTASILDPANPGFKADLYAIVNWINNNSELISATADAAASGGAPNNTTSPVFLSGGYDNIDDTDPDPVDFLNWQNALNLLKQTRVNTIVVLTADPAVHAALDAHCAYMGGIGRSERDGFVGLMNTAQDGLASKTELKSQIIDLNTRHIRACGQTVERFNTSGEREVFDPPFRAAMYAGMQAGSPVGTSLTYKFENSLGFTQDSSWNPTDDAEELIQAGLIFTENVEGVGRRVVRNITTHLSSNNLAFIEGSVNEAVNFAVFNFRTNLEFAVGKRGFSGTINATKGIAIGTLGLLVDEGTLVAYRSLDIELIVDVMEVSVEIAPVLPINFVKTVAHLVTIRQSAA